MAVPASELKPYKSFPELLQSLTNRGLAIGDNQWAIAAIRRHGYYRLSGYFYPLRRTNPVGHPGRQDQFSNGSSIELVVKLAEFDKALRLLVLDGIETIEVAMRVAIAHKLGALDPEAHLNPRFFVGAFTKGGDNSEHTKWIARFEERCRKSRDDFVEHHRTKYGGRMPIWVAIEVWDFGLLTRLFDGLQIRDQIALAQQVGLGDGRVLHSWLMTFNSVRNIAAHHARLWNRSMTKTPALPKPGSIQWLQILHDHSHAREKLFGALTLMRYIIAKTHPQSDWHHRLKQHMQTFPETALLSIASAGFPDGWATAPAWA